MAGDIRDHVRRLGTRQALALSQRLQADRHLRDQWSVFFVEGVRNLLGALDHDWGIDAVLFSDRLLTSGIARSKVRALRRAGVSTFKLTPEQFRAVSQARNASGVAAIVRQRTLGLKQIVSSGACLLGAESIEFTGNLGTLLRTSAAAGGTGLIMLGPRIDPYCPTLVRSSMGTVFRQEFYRAGYDEFKSWVRRAGAQVVGASPAAPTTHFGFAFKKPCVIVLGNERRGLSSQLKKLCTAVVRIPMVAGIDSLNVSVAGSLLLYEVARASRQGTPKSQTRSKEGVALE